MFEFLNISLPLFSIYMHKIQWVTPKNITIENTTGYLLEAALKKSGKKTKRIKNIEKKWVKAKKRTEVRCA